MPAIPVEVQNLEDEELFAKLTELGIDVGPIVASTRKLYEKKLVKLLTGETDVVDSTNGTEVEEPEIMERHSPKKRAMFETDYSQPKNTIFSTRQTDDEISNEARKRVTVKRYESEKNERNINERSTQFGPDLHVLSPRPSLRSVMSTTSTTTTTKYITPGGSIRETTLLRETYGSPSVASKEQPSSITRLLVKLFIMIAIIVIIYVVYQYVYSESPFKELENLARQTLDSIQTAEANSQDKMKRPKVTSS